MGQACGCCTGGDRPKCQCKCRKHPCKCIECKCTSCSDKCSQCKYCTCNCDKHCKNCNIKNKQLPKQQVKYIPPPPAISKSTFDRKQCRLEKCFVDSDFVYNEPPKMQYFIYSFPHQVNFDGKKIQ